MKDILKFLEDLQLHNERDWFHAHKDRYLESRDQFLSMVRQIIEILQMTDDRLQSLDPKDTMFRINRDVRFSQDKSPYKTHFGAYIAKGGRKSRNAGYYFHVGADQVFTGAGVYQPEKEELKVIRQEILFQPDKYISLLSEGSKAGFALIEDDKLKTGPKGFDKYSPHIDLIKYKHYFQSRKLTPDEINSSEISRIVSGELIKLFPFTDFLNTAMEFTGNE